MGGKATHFESFDGGRRVVKKSVYLIFLTGILTL